jgi:predicted kinase
MFVHSHLDILITYFAIDFQKNSSNVLDTKSILHMIRLTLLIGLPGSGKSTWARQLITENPQRLLISTDGIRAQLFGEEIIQGDWLLVWQEVESQLRTAVAKISSGEAKTAIYDATNVVRKSRREAIALARTTGFTHITGVWFDLPLEVCLERNQQRDRQVPSEVILQMNRQLQDAPPDLRDGLDYLIRRQN